MDQYPPSGWNGQPSGPQNNPPTSEFGPVQPQPQSQQQPPQAYQQQNPHAFQHQQPQPQPNPYGYGPPPKQGMSTPVVVGLTVAIVLLVGLIVAAAVLVIPRFTGAAEAPTTSTVSVTATAPAENGGSGAEAVPTVQPARPAPSGKPAGAYECWSGGSAAYNSVAVGSSVTSCEFAEAVWSQYMGSGGNGQSKTVRAYSPVTGSSYTMSCSGGSVVTCTGGNNAVVHIY